jgi:hypothetical protein
MNPSFSTVGGNGPEIEGKTLFVKKKDPIPINPIDFLLSIIPRGVVQFFFNRVPT